MGSDPRKILFNVATAQVADIATDRDSSHRWERGRLARADAPVGLHGLGNLPR